MPGTMQWCLLSASENSGKSVIHPGRVIECRENKRSRTKHQGFGCAGGVHDLRVPSSRGQGG